MDDLWCNVSTCSLTVFKKSPRLIVKMVPEGRISRHMGENKMDEEDVGGLGRQPWISAS